MTAKGRLLINEAVAEWVFPTNPWYKVKKFPRLLVPWAKERYGRKWAEEHAKALFYATEGFAAIARETKGIERWKRREIIRKTLTGVKYPEKKRPPRTPGRVPTKEEEEEIIRKVREWISRIRPGVELPK